MIIDCHVHICPESVRRNRAPYLEDEPEFAAIYSDPRAALIGAHDLIQAMDAEGVDRSVVFGFPWRKEAHFRENNDYVLDACRRYPERLLPLGCFHVQAREALAEARRCLASGCLGIGELAFYTSGLDAEARQSLDPVARMCAEAGALVMLHTNEPVGHHYPGKSPMHLADLYRLIESCPETRWILAHLGGGLPWFGFLKRTVREVLRNCWFDTAAMPFLYRPEALKAFAEAIGEDRLLFGSDYPLLPPSRYYKELDRSGLPDETRRKILGQNAARLLGLSR